MERTAEVPAAEELGLEREALEETIAVEQAAGPDQIEPVSAPAESLPAAYFVVAPAAAEPTAVVWEGEPQT